jgi:hypothetical protein
MLFRYFFKLKAHPNSTKPQVLGRAGIQFWLGKKHEYFDYTLVDSVKDWRAKWFYAGNMLPPLAVHSNTDQQLPSIGKKKP